MCRHDRRGLSCLQSKRNQYVRARVSNRVGAGEPIGEPAPPPGILEAMEDDLRSKLPDELVDELLAGASSEEEIVGPGGLLGQLTKRLVERAMEVELTDHLGYERHQEPPGGAGNTRNGATPKTLSTEHGPVEIRTPRDRDGSFEPKIVRKRQRRFEGFDEKILALYSRGMSVRDVQAHLRELYGVEVSAGSDQPGHRRGHGRRARVAAATARRRLPGAVPRRVRGQDPRRRLGATPRLLPRAGRRHGRVARRAGDVVSSHRGREVLDAGPDRAQAARRAGHPDLLRRRAQGVPRGDRSRLPRDGGADVHRAPDPHQPQIRPAPRLRPGRQRPQADLHRDQRRGRRAGARDASIRNGAPSCR